MDLGVSYIAAHLPEHIERDMKHLKEIGCNEVLFAMQENHIRTLTGALRFGGRIAKEQGLRPYALIWGYANTFGGGRISNIMLENPGMWRVGKDGEKVPEGCLNNTMLADKFLEITEQCRDYGFEGIFIDEPTWQDCFCKKCRELFADSFGKKLRQSEGTKEYGAFQQATVRDFTQSVCRRVKELDANVKTFTCIMPRDRAYFEEVAAIEELDVFATDPYWLRPIHNMTIEQACDYARLVKQICEERGKASQIWLNCWGIPKGVEEQIYTGGKQLAAVGCDSFYTWSYRGGLGTREECDDPYAAWDNLVRLYQELSQA